MVCHDKGQLMGFLKRRRKGATSDDYMWLDPQRVNQSTAPPEEEPAPPPTPGLQLPPPPPPPIPVEKTSEPEGSTPSA